MTKVCFEIENFQLKILYIDYGQELKPIPRVKISDQENGGAESPLISNSKLQLDDFSMHEPKTQSPSIPDQNPFNDEYLQSVEAKDTLNTEEHSEEIDVPKKPFPTYNIFSDTIDPTFNVTPKPRSRSLRNDHWSLFEEDSVAPPVVESPLVLLGRQTPAVKFGTIFDDEEKQIAKELLFVPSLTQSLPEPQVMFMPPKTPRGRNYVAAEDDFGELTQIEDNRGGLVLILKF